jgi:hypothetical protein
MNNVLKEIEGTYLLRYQRLGTLDRCILAVELGSHNVSCGLDPVVLPSNVLEILQFVPRMKNWEFVSDLLEIM